MENNYTPEELSIIVQAKANGTYLKAPNGEVSNLSPEQWVQVRTVAFKEWFGDWQNDKEKASQILDQNGEPAVMYHGSKSSFTEFNIDKAGSSNKMGEVGFWFTPIESFAKQFAEDAWWGEEEHVTTYNTYLSIKNPKVYEPKDVTEEQESLQNELTPMRRELKELQEKWSGVDWLDNEAFHIALRDGFPNDEAKEYYAERTPNSKQAIIDGERVKNLLAQEKILSEKLFEYIYNDPYEQLKTDLYKFAGMNAEDANIAGTGMAIKNEKEVLEKFKESLRLQGYDGIIVKGTRYDSRFAGGVVNDQYVAFYPNQIKSSLENIGTYSLDNDDIRFRFIGEKGAANLDRAEEATVRLDNLTIAREMESVGKDSLSIKIATGWERGADDKWRYEDHDFEIRTEHVGQYKNDKAGSTKPTYYIHTKMSTGTVGKLSDFVRDDNLFQAYPQLIDAEVKFVKPNTDVRGTTSDGVIALSINYFSEVYEILNSEAVASAKARSFELYEHIPKEIREESLDLLDAFGGDTNRMNNVTYKGLAEQYPEIEEFIKSVDNVPANEAGVFLGYRLNNLAKGVLSHEIQHAIQHIEGFAHGGSPIQFSDSTNFEHDIRKFNSIVEDVIQGNEYEKLGELLKSDKYSGFRESFTSDRDKEVIRVLKMWYNDLPEKVFMENYQYSVENGRKGTASEQYYKLSGEVEARNVQSRMDMTLEERRNSLAVFTEDVRREDQLFLKNSFSESMNSSKAEFIPTIESLANSLHTPVDIVNDINELPHDSVVRRKIESGCIVKGWFVPATNNVTVYLPNIDTPEDAHRTVFHEAVGHYGLRKLFGEHFDKFLDNVYNHASPDIQGKILYATHGEPAQRLVATEEYLAKLAEKGFSDPNEVSLWGKVKLAFVDMLCQAKVKLGFKLHDNDLRGVLWKSYQKLAKEGSLNKEKGSVISPLDKDSKDVIKRKDNAKFSSSIDTSYIPTREVRQNIPCNKSVNDLSKANRSTMSIEM